MTTHGDSSDDVLPSVPPRIGTELARSEWWQARLRLLSEEKKLTRHRDAVSAARRALPRLEVEDRYALTGPDGSVRLLDLFQGRRQLIVFHFMPRFDDDQWCPICSFWIDNVGHLAHLRARDTEFAVVCPEPLADGLLWRARMGWEVPWYSCEGTTFYEDFHVELPDTDPDPDFPDDWRDPPGVSTFVRDGDRVFYSYSTYRRGSDALNGSYQYLDLTPLGRQEEDPEDPMGWLRPHDEYTAADLPGHAGAGTCCGGGA